MKFLVQNYSCLQNPWLGVHRPQIPVLSVLNRICWPPPRKKFLGTPLTLIPTCILWVNLCKICVLKLGPDDDLDEVERYHGFELSCYLPYTTEVGNLYNWKCKQSAQKNIWTREEWNQVTVGDYCLVTRKFVIYTSPPDLFSPHVSTALVGVGFLYEGPRSHSQTHHTPLDEWLVRRRDLYLTTNNTGKRQTSMPTAGFEPAVPASERP